MRSVKDGVRAATMALVAIVIAASAASRPSAYDGDSRARLMSAHAKMPLAFVENRGQVDPRVRFYAHGPRYAFHLTREAAMFSFVESASVDRGVVLELRFLGAGADVLVEGQDRASGEVNYLLDNDTARWHTHVPRFSQVRYRNLWPLVDMLVRGEPAALKYEFRLAPGAKIADIRLAYEGAQILRLEQSGALALETALGVIRDSAPVAYQTIGGARIPVEMHYVLNGNEYRFAAGDTYDPRHELVIDPGIDYSTYLGGSSHESPAAVAVDSAGNAYVTGITQSPNFPTTAGAFDRTGSASNNLDAFVTKLNSDGTALVYSTFLGGSNFEWGRGIAIDAAGNAYIAGQTKSSDFPTTSNAFDRTFNVDTCPRCGIDQYDAFVAKLNATGSGLVYSTFLGGFDIDDALAIAVDGAGNAYVGGETGSNNFPVTAGAFDTTRNGAFDAFVANLNASGSALVYSTYLGGLEVEYIAGAAVDAAGNAYMTGITRSADFPTTPGAFDTTQNGLFDVFVTKFDPTGALVYSTFLGGTDFDSVGGIAIDDAGSAYVAGGAASLDYPTTPGAYDRITDGSDAFVTKLNAAGTALVYSTFVGGTGGDGASAIVLDDSGQAWITGSTDSAEFPTTPATAFDTTPNGSWDAFVAQLDAAGAVLLHGTLFGGSASDGTSDIALDAGGNVIVVGQTMSPDLPTTAGAFDRVFNGDPLIFWADAFVAKFATGSPLATPPPPPAPSAPTLLAPANGASPAQPIAFDWNDVANAVSYTIQIDDSSAFSTPVVVQQSVTASQFSIGGLASVQHWWRVRGVNSNGVAGAWSAIRTFTPQGGSPPPPPPPGTLPAPSLVSPANDARFPPGSTIRFDWTDVAGASSYTIQIDNTETFAAPFTVDQTVGVSQFTTSTLPTTRMWWRVRANNSTGTASAWSPVRRFELKD